MKATIAELNRHPERYLNLALKEPVIFERSGRPVAVLVSYERYLQLEDAYWGELAVVVDQEDSLGTKASMAFLRGDK